ncbi:MAG: tetratricopeptide repeat protein [Planctomycetota bacterium]
MATKVNTKLVVVLAAALILLVGGLAGFYYTVVRKSTSELEATGDRHLVLARDAADTVAADSDAAAAEAQRRRDRDYRLAAESYGLAWQRDPTNVEILLKYIEARRNMSVRDQFEAQRVLREILNLTRRATELRPGDDRLLEDYYQTLYRWGQEFNVPSFFNELFTATSARLETDPSNLPALKFRGISQNVQLSDSMARGDQQQALDDLETVLAQRPDDTDVLHHLARWHLYDAGRSERAAPGSATADAARARVLEYADQALASAPDDPQVKIEYLTVMLGLGDLQLFRARRGGDEDAMAEGREQYAATLATVAPVLADLEATMLERPEPALLVQQIAEMLPRVERQRAALENARRLDEGLEPLPGDSRNHLARTQALLRSAVEKRPEMLLYRLMLANVLKLQLELDAAHEIYVSARDHEVRGNFEASLRDQVLRQQAIFEVANIELIRAEAADDPDRRAALLAATDTAVDELETVAGEDVRVLMLRGKTALLRNQTTRAMQFLDRASDLYADRDIEALLLSARARQAERQWGAAAERLQQVLALVGGAGRVEIRSNLRLQLAEMLIRGRQFETARQQIEVVLETEPGNVTARRLLAQWYRNQDDTDAAIAQLETIPEADRGADVSRSLAGLYARRGDATQGRDLLAQQFEADPRNVAVVQALLPLLETPEDQLALLDRAAAAGADSRAVSLLRFQIESRRSETGVTLEQLIAQVVAETDDPMDRELRQAQAYLRYNRHDDARPHLDAARQLDADNDQLLLLDLSLAIHDREFDRARRLVAEAGARNLDLADGHLLRGRLAAAEGLLPQAISAYDQALELRPVFDEGWRQYGDLLMRADDASEAVIAYDTAVRQKPDNVPALLGLAAAHDALGRRGAALDTLRTALSYAPRNPAVVQRYAAYEQRHGDPAAVLALRRRLADNRPDDLDNFLRLALLEAESGQTRAALDRLASRSEELGEVPGYLATLANVYRLAGQTEKGLDVLVSHVNARGDDATSEDHLLIARYLMRAGQTPPAVAAYQKAAAVEDPDRRTASRELGDVLFNAGRHDDAAAVYRDLFASVTDDDRQVLGARYAESLIRAGQTDAAAGVLDGLEPTATIDALRAVLAAAEGRTDDALRLADRSIAKDDRNAAAYVQRARLLAANPQRTRDAMNDLDRALAIDPGQVAALTLQAQLHLRDEEPRRAIFSLRSLLEQNPGDAAARRQLAELYLGQGRVADAEELIDAARNLQPDNPGWALLAANLAAARGDTAEAIPAYESLLEQTPNAEVLGRLAALHLQNRDPARARDALDAHPQLVADTPVLQALRGAALAGLGQAEPAERVFVLALQRSTTRGEAAAVLQRMVTTLGPEPAFALAEGVDGMADPSWVGLIAAQTAMAAGDYDTTRARLSRLRETLPADAAARERVDAMDALAMLQMGDPAGSRDLYRSLLQRSPDNLEYLNNLAFVLASELDDPESALPMARRAAERAPDNAEIVDTLGWTLYQVGQVDEARTTLERSIRLRALPANTLHLGRLLLETGNDATARGVLEQALELSEQAADTDRAAQARRLLQQIR